MQRVTRPTARVLAIMLERPTRWLYGYDIMQSTDIASGTLYPLLTRLLDDGFLEGRWEDSPFPGRPPRHQYRLTADGRVLAREAVASAREGWLADLRLSRA